MSGLARFARSGTDGTGEAPADAVERLLGPRPAPAPGESCELCSAPMGDDHRHVVDLDQRGIMCTCRPCGLLFTGGAEAHEHFRTVPDRFLRLAPFHLSVAQWAALQIPVGVTFVILDSRLGRPVAFYPSPGGATQSELALDSWDDLVASNPPLADIEPDVEAALIRNERDQPAQCHIVPVDRCYELVGTMRLRWRGFDGGQEVREAMASFFEDIDSRARPTTGGDR